MNKSVNIIGSGFSGLASAALLAKEGYEVNLFEKNSTTGGRARQFSENGFLFDMGPSWYWMPEVFERFYRQFGKTTEDFYELKLLEPGFRVYFGKGDYLNIPSEYEDLRELFERIEPGASLQLDRFMQDAKVKYDLGINDLVYKPGKSLMEYMNSRVILGTLKHKVFQRFDKHVRSYFKNPKLISLMEFPILFLGAMPKDTPALYSLMNYAGLKLGTYYPMGGFGKVINAFERIAREQGVHIHTRVPIEEILVSEGRATGLRMNGHQYKSDTVIAATDYHHVEHNLLSPQYRTYSEKYWDSRVFAPSSLLFYLGIDKKIENLEHHNLFFDESLEDHAVEIYKTPKWPSKPLFYACVPSKTDPEVAPEGKENIFLLMPIAPGLNDEEDLREKYYTLIMDRLEAHAGENIRDHVIVKKSYSVRNFENDYNAYKGNAYGLANTLLQTGPLKPKMHSKKVKNLFYTGQITVPGPGVPPSIISGEVVAKLIRNL